MKHMCNCICHEPGQGVLHAVPCCDSTYEKRQIESIFTESIDNIGDLIPLDEWKQYVGGGMFIDYDGYGSAVNKTEGKQTKQHYFPSDLEKIPKGTTHINWYNR